MFKCFLLPEREESDLRHLHQQNVPLEARGKLNSAQQGTASIDNTYRTLHTLYSAHYTTCTVHTTHPVQCALHNLYSAH